LACASVGGQVVVEWLMFAGFVAVTCCWLTLRARRISATAPPFVSEPYVMLGGSRNGWNTNSYPAAQLTLTSTLLRIDPHRVIPLTMPKHVPTAELPRSAAASSFRRHVVGGTEITFLVNDKRVAFIPTNLARFDEAWRALGWPTLACEMSSARNFAARLTPRLGCTCSRANVGLQEP
jgi:hypothetical protein